MAIGAIFSLVVALAAAATDRPCASYITFVGVNAMGSQSETTEAEAACRRAVAAGDASAHLYLGIVLRVVGKTEEAKAELTLAIAHDPSSAIAAYQRGYVHIDGDDFPAAIADFSAALALAPGDADILYERGIAHQETGDFDSALADYQAAIAAQPDFAMAYLGVARVHQIRGARDPAIVASRRAREIAVASGDTDTVARADQYLSELGAN